MVSKTLATAGALCSALLPPRLAAQEPEPHPQAPTRSVSAALSPAAARAHAARIDRLLEQGLAQRGIAPTAPVDDATFARRAFLAAVGRIPSGAEVESFLQDGAADKRTALVDRLLDSPGHTSHAANQWFDLLRVKSRQRQTSGEPFAHWIREAVRTGMPYDRFVRDMLAAEGPAHREGNGATGYLLRDANMPHDAMANTLRLFLGTRLECAQCHNHPSDKWTQREFYAMAAFFGGLRYRLPPPPALAQQARNLRDADDRTRRAARRLLQTAVTGLAGSGTGVERLPADYAYDDARPRSPVTAATIFGADVQLERRERSDQPARPRGRRGQDRPRGRDALPAEPGVGSRAAFAGWLTSADNERFLRVATNRVWQQLFGRALIEPIDDLKDDSRPVHPRLQEHLERLLVGLDFDLRQFQRVLMLTRLFQREVVAGDPPADEPFAFAGPLLRRMSAEQMWDSLLTLAVDDVDALLGPTDARAQAAYRSFAEVDGASAAELQAMLEQPDAARRMLQERAAERREQLRGLQQRARSLQQELRAARRAGDRDEIARLEAEIAALAAERRQRAGGRDGTGELQRASDLPQPAPGGHLLRQFGQSDRETIDAASLDATVPQALTLLNGFLDQRVLSAGSSLQRRLTAQAAPEQRIRAAFLATLSREPRPDEVATWQPALAGDPREGLRDLVWVLCNSHEFRFRR